LWERAASAGPTPLSPVLADHLASCPACQAEGRAVGELLATTRALPDAAPPADLWDGFDEELARRLAHGRNPVVLAWRRWGSRVTKVAAILVVGVGLGFAAARMTDDAADDQAARERSALLARLAVDARIENALARVEEGIAATEASGMVAGAATPSAEAAARLERLRAERDELRRLLATTLAAEREAEAHGFGYLDRRIAGIAGGGLLEFVP
jgi:hypothetical protein